MLNDTLTKMINNLPWNRGGEADEELIPDLAPLAVQDAAIITEMHPDAAEEREALLAHEVALIQAAQRGDELAFGELMDTHYSHVYGLACRTVRDPDEAAEIAQDVFWAAWRSLGGFRGEARFGTWLYRITYRRCLQSIEAHQNRIAALSQFAALHIERMANEWNEMQANLAEQEWCQAIREQVDMLPVKYQAVLLLRHFQELSYEEIAQQLTIPISSVKTQLFRARALLRDRLQQVELPKVEMPRVEMPNVGSAIRGGLDSLGNLLHGHVQSA